MILPSRSRLSFAGVLRSQAEQRPDQTAFVFLGSKLDEQRRLTYLELDRLARLCAERLSDHARPGGRAVLACPQGPEFVVGLFGCFYAGVIAVPVPAPQGSRGTERFRAVVRDCSPAIVLGSSAAVAKGGTQNSGAGPAWLAVDTDGAADGEGYYTESGGEETALIQYTSGSTGNPAGVVLTHDNLLENSQALASAFRYSTSSFCVSWLPPFHDMGLIGTILQPVHGGFTGALMQPSTFLSAPVQWLRAISRYRADLSGGPNFAYDLCVRNIRQPETEGLDLSCWRVAFNGSDRVRLHTMEAFSAQFARVGFDRHAFYPCYGLAESTLIVTGGEPGRIAATKHVDTPALDRGVVLRATAAHDRSSLVSCGRSMPRHIVRIVDPESHRICKAGQIGEIWVAGPSVARSYWNAPDTTAERLSATLADDTSTRFLRTGDLGFEDAGELYVTGRLRDLLIIRGVNHIPDEIEDTAASAHTGLVPGGAVALVSEEGSGDGLVVIAEAKRSDHALDEALRAIVDAVAARHGLAVDTVILVRAGSLPRTSSGKLQRQDCRKRYSGGRLRELAKWTRSVEGEIQSVRADIPPGDGVRSFLLELLAGRLNRKVAEIDSRAALCGLGLDSLEAVRISHALETRLGQPLPTDLLLSDCSIDELAAKLDSLAGAGLSKVEVPEVTDDEASHGERALWYIHQSASASSAYNIAVAFRLRREASRSTVLNAIESVVERHAALRSRFTWKDDVLRRVTSGDRWEVMEMARGCPEELRSALEEAANARFDLEAGPLFRAHYFESAEGPVVLLVAHHMVADLWSMAIILREIGQYLAGQPVCVPAERMTYASYSAWQARMLASPEGRQACEYWQRRLANAAVLDFATDYPRPTLSRYKGAAIRVLLDQDVTAAIHRLAAAHGTTPYVVLLAAFQVFSSRSTGSPDICVGSPFACRPHSALQDTVGYFANTVVLRAGLEKDQSFDSFLEVSRETVRQAHVHQYVPFSVLAEIAGVASQGNRNPLVRAFFVFHNRMEGIAYQGSSQCVGPETFELLPLERRSSQVDLALELADEGERLVGALVYDTDLFRHETASRMAAQFQTLLNGLLKHPEGSIDRTPMVSEVERKALVGASTGNRKRHCVASLLECIAQQAPRPDAIAVVFDDAMLTYSELMLRTERLAQVLAGRGVQPEIRVALFMERSIDLVVAILGALRAGAAYVPIDVDTPAARLEAILRDIDPNVVLTQASRAPALRGYDTPSIALDADWAPVQGRNRLGGAAGDQLAYVIYTSGSTGKPKGVMNTHAGLANRILWMQERYGLTGRDRALQKTPYSFDVSVWEFLWPLAAGATLIVARPNLHRSSAYLAQIIAEQCITVVHFVPSMLEAFLHEVRPEACRSLRLVICSGEALQDGLRQRFQSLIPWAELHNLYGPTEASIDVTEWDCRGAARLVTVPIGRAIHNSEVYVLDRHLEIQPVGVPGEIYIGGVGLARGYLNSPALTADRFGPDCVSDRHGGRLYRTGDIGRYIEAGVIEFLGRADQQVKIRGFRIEPGEVEAVLLRHPAVREATVAVSKGPTNDQRLVAYLTGERASAGNLGTLARANLPDYMTPAAFVWLDALPRTASGKIDRRALPEPDGLRPELDSPYVAPSTPVESELAGMWSELLGKQEIGVRDTFFELGGHSILLAQLLSRIREQFGVDIPIPMLLEQTINIEMLAKYIEDEQISQASTIDVLTAVQEVQSLTAGPTVK
ncbi:MAG TPA: amino acid adenylation domain-containing protein [Bryobacteraceae bacterium]|nr:amino acid adenylation domain-containing protein [Bryobacteraceae bacterium]